MPQLSAAREIQLLLGAGSGPRRLVLVVDASASMSEPPPGSQRTQSKWDLMRQGVAEFLHALPADSVVGVRVLGQGTERCAASQQLREPRALGNDGAREVVVALEQREPSGDTPLAEAIRAAAGDLGESGGEIIVVSDGRETCASAEELCETARSVASRGDTFRINVVATFMAESERAELTCVTDATGGFGVTLLHADPGALAAVLLRLAPVRLLTAGLLVTSGGLTIFCLCGLLAEALGTVLVRGTAGFFADVVFAASASLWAAFWLTRLAHFPFTLTAVFVAALVAVLYREIPRRRAAAGGWAWP